MKCKHLLLLSLILISQALEAKSKVISKFSEVKIQTGLKVTHKIRNANLLGLTRDQIIVIGENKLKQRLLVVYEILQEEHLYSEVSRIIIPDNYLSFDLLKTKQTQKLIFLSNDSLMEYLAIENRFIFFNKSQSIYLQDKADYLVEKDFIDDFNGDGLDDIKLIDFSGVHFLIQTESGLFEQQTINIKPHIEARQLSAQYTETEMFFADFNLDKRNDLIVVVDHGLEVYFQLDNGLFNKQAKRVELPIDVKALDWWKIKESNGESPDQNKIAHKTVHMLSDINNDEITDLIVLYTQTEGVLDRKNSYEVYIGRAGKDIVEFSPTPTSIIESKGAVAEFKLLDLNGDKKSEIIISSLDIGLSKIIGALLSGSIEQDIYFYKTDKNDNYGNKPAAEKDVDVNFSLSSGKSDDPVVKIADFNGDGFKDLMLSDGEKSLRIFEGVNNKKLFAKRSLKHSILLPKNGALLETGDLNNDGKDDVVIRYGRQDNKETQNQIVILFAN